MPSQTRPLTFISLAALLAASLLTPLGLEAAEIPIGSWPAPQVTLGPQDIGLSEATFIPVTPCRVADTRAGSGFTGSFGPPSLAASGGRSIPFTISPCGIPSGALAVSMNVTVTNTLGAGFILAYPTGGSVPQVSTVNYSANQTVANAAILPLNAFGSANFIAGVSGTDLILDVNGYFKQTLQGGNLTVAINHPVAAIKGVNGNDSMFASGVLGDYEGGNIGWGVSGDLSSAAASGSAGVKGASGFGASTTQYGVRGYGLSTGLDSAAIYGRHTATAPTAHGVMGVADSTHPNAAGVYGQAANADANGGKFHNVGAGGTTAYLATRISTVDYALYTPGIVKCGILQASTKNFVAPHPADPSKEIVYTSVEAPTADIYFRGSGRLVNGIARIEVPEHFRLSAREGSYATTVTPVGGRAQVWVEEEGPRGVVIAGSGDAAFHYVVWAERDAIESESPVRTNASFTPAAIEKGGGVKSLPAGYRDVLVKNGTLNEDGTWDLRTARRLGWELPAANQ